MVKYQQMGLNMIFKLLVEEIVKNYNAYENIDKTPVNIVEKYRDWET